MGNHGELDLPVWFRWTGKLMNGDCITEGLAMAEGLGLEWQFLKEMMLVVLDDGQDSIYKIL